MVHMFVMTSATYGTSNITLLVVLSDLCSFQMRNFSLKICILSTLSINNECEMKLDILVATVNTGCSTALVVPWVKITDTLAKEYNGFYSRISVK